jgi:hypothetical protein
MYRFSRQRTKPQAILMLCSLLMFIVVAINVFVYLLIPQYAIYGDQHYSSIDNVCKNSNQLNVICFEIFRTAQLLFNPVRNLSQQV